MEPSHTPQIITEANVRRWLQPQRVGLLAFLASMPLNVLNGHGPGWLADFDHFQGWEVAWGFGFVISTRMIEGAWGSMSFLAIGLPIAITTAFTLTMPFVDLGAPGVGSTISRALKTVGALSFIATTVFICGWAVNDGAFWGAIPWLGGAGLVLFGALRQRSRRISCRYRWSFRLRTLFVALTGFAVLAMAISTRPEMAAPVVLFVALVGAMAVPVFLQRSAIAIEEMPPNSTTEGSVIP